MFVLKHNGVFPLRFVAFGVGFRVVMRCFGGVVVGHAPLAFIVEAACRQLGNKPWRNVGPAVHEIVLAHLGHVHEAVAVGIVARLPVFKMEQEAGGQSVVEMNVGIGVGFQFGLGVKIEIAPHAFCGLGLLELNVDLSRGALRSVFYT